MLNFTAPIAALWAIFMTYWMAVSLGSGKKTKYRRKTLAGGPIVRILLIILIALAWGIPSFALAILSQSFTLKIIGLLITLLGLAFAVWARQTLGTNWSANPAETKEGHELVTSGPYRLVRHPIYSGEAFALLGSVLADGKLRMLVIAATVIIGLIARLRIEEKLMEKEFPGAYDRYKKESKMLIPGIF